ncbi:response regulator [Methylotuvimicrobium alcaliphilum]|uniref:Polar-differentiation response regulator divK n=1 Tax=Methylotuvimicrobium alcaliphilum (strain DSM 19304 / NCIMB 14124 / VKM B-2133 / 20Z) TaxID=1091494 RepID=G4SXH5_META2|nr:response regulator [Methylotuvimicrobium alcaliphilum]CCE25339.1 Polar-differentiation response regulator divK [Methylotuvimicrobium alcaliphilum 20Z]
MTAQILVVEDTFINMKLVCMLLEKAGYRVLRADNAEDGIALAQRYLPDLILMDIQLPDMDGLEATRLLKKADATKHIKVVALTAFAMKGDEEKMIAAGCDGYIAKPIQYKNFLGEVEKTLSMNLPKEERHDNT